MKLLNKTALAIAFSVAGVLSSVSALAMTSDVKEVKHRIEVVADESENMRVFVSVNGDMTKVEVPKEALTDEDQLADALVDVPEELKTKLFKTSRPKSALIINEACEKGFFYLEKTSNDQRKKFIKPSDSFIKEFNEYLDTLKSLSF